MKIVLLLNGKTFPSYIGEGISEYEKRVGHYLPFEMEILPDLKNTKKLSFKQIKEKEGEYVKDRLNKGDFIVLLDDKGKEFDSLEFASYIKNKIMTVPKRLVFIIGGPYGFSEEVYRLANEKISFSRMTFSHQLIRLVFMEQLYRAFTIINNEPYHHE